MMQSNKERIKEMLLDIGGGFPGSKVSEEIFKQVAFISYK